MLIRMRTLTPYVDQLHPQHLSCTKLDDGKHGCRNRECREKGSYFVPATIAPHLKEIFSGECCLPYTSLCLCTCVCMHNMHLCEATELSCTFNMSNVPGFVMQSWCHDQWLLLIQYCWLLLQYPFTRDRDDHIHDTQDGEECKKDPFFSVILG